MERDLGGSFDMRGLSKFADCNQALRRTYVAVGQNLTLHGRLTVDRVLRALNPKSSWSIRTRGSDRNRVPSTSSTHFRTVGHP